MDAEDQLDARDEYSRGVLAVVPGIEGRGLDCFHMLVSYIIFLDEI